MKFEDFLALASTKTYDGVNDCLFVVVHETDNPDIGADALAHAELQASDNVRNASWHVQVDDTRCIRSFPWATQCWHAGDGRGPGNLSGIAVEICVNADGDFEAAFRNAAWAVAQILNEIGRPITAVKQHYDFSRKDCPHKTRTAQRWNEFLQLVAEAQASGVPSTVPPRGGATVSSKMHSPIKNGRVSSPYGQRSTGMHAGMDLAPKSKSSTRVFASFAGTVARIVRGRKPGNKSRTNELAPYRTGNGLIIRNPDGEYQLYGHVATLNSLAVGDKVAAGQLLGSTDLSGNTTGHHVHYEEWLRSSTLSSPITRNPLASFNHFGVTPGSDTGQGAEAAPTTAPTPVAPHPTAPTAPTAPQPDPAVLAWQKRANRFGNAGLVEDGIKGSKSLKWEAWVIELQKKLNEWKAVQRLGKLRPDGDFGQLTSDALFAVQDANRGTFGYPDRVVGARTVKALGISPQPYVGK